MFYNKIKSFIVILLVVTLLPNVAIAVVLNATGLVGQTDASGNPVYTTRVVHNNQGGPTAIGFGTSNGSTVDFVNHRLFVGDSTNYRVLVFPLDSNNKIASTTASYVLGQPNFTATGANLTQNGFAGGFFSAMTYDTVHNRLFINDAGAHRVMVYDLSNGITNGMNASYVIGQENFTTANINLTNNPFAPTRNGMYFPDGVGYDGVHNRLFVSDQNNSRVLIYELDNIANGMNASYVLGQPDFASDSMGQDENLVLYPNGVIYDPVYDRVFVNSVAARRTLVFNVSPAYLAANNPGFGTALNADYVLGQANFTASVSSVSRNTLLGPDDAMGFDPVTQRLFIADNTGIRIMIYNVAPSNISNGMNAENVLFQADYTSSATGTTQSLVRHPNGTTSWDPVTNRLFLKDRSNYRILEFSMIRITKPTVSNGNIGVAYADTITTESATGTSQDFSVFSGVLPPGLSLNTATGVISGTPTTATTSTFSIKATDNFSTGPIYNVVSYTMSIASTTPGSPTALSATTGLNQAVVSFTPPTSDGGTPITSYTVTSSPGGITATGSASPITVTGLSVSTTYTFTVVATNEAGNSVASAPSNPITTYSLGNGPVVGGGSISLPWEAKPRPQIVYPDGRVVYTDTATTTTSTTTTPVLAPVLATSTVTVPNTTTPSGITSTFTRDLKFDDSSSDVKQLQIFFNTHGFTVATTGPGAPGEETTIFGKLTKAAVIKFQETYASEILAQFGLTNGTGFVGPATRAKILQLLGR